MKDKTAIDRLIRPEIRALKPGRVSRQSFRMPTLC